MARILDIADDLTSYATRLLAECGHDVVLVEPRAGDLVRRLAPFLGNVIDLEHGAYHRYWNAGKRSISVNLEAEAGRDLLFDLAKTADAVVLSDRCPVRAEELAAANPESAIVVVEAAEEPYLLRAAHSGLLSLVGDPAGSPLMLGGRVMDCVIAFHAAIATAGAIYQGKQRGEGQIVRISAKNALEAMMEQAVITYANEERVAQRIGHRGEVTAASGAFAASDGFWMLSMVGGGKAWNDFMEWVGDPVLMADPSLADEAGRQASKLLIADRLEAWSTRHSKALLVEGAQRRHIPASPVSNITEVLHDPQLLARGFLVDEDHPEFGPIRTPGGAIATTRGEKLRPAPRLGQHNAELLDELGYSVEEHAALFATGAL
jgi:crotonobetainyl-CoA:carnitine CoA-transferase CaiB-like acyl-CoA transferase